MSLPDLSPILLAAQSVDFTQRAAAEEQLKLLNETQYPLYIASVATEMATAAKPLDSRRMAGILLKTMLTAKEEARKAHLQARWVALDPAIKQHVREALLATLATEAKEVRHTAAMALAAVAAIDLPRKEWPTLIAALMSNMGGHTVAMPGTRQATLEAMGFVCEEMAQIKEEVLTPQEINQILTAVVAGMGATEPDETRLAATEALHNAIEFAQHNFDNDQERNYLMQVVCQGTQSPDIRIRVASFECLHAIASLYYNKLVPYMTEIYAITVKAIKEDQEEVALQALEFWSTIAEEEADRLEDQDPTAPCLNFMKAAPHLVPILLEMLLKQEEGQEQDDTSWNISIASGTCLGLTARVVQDDIVPMVMPFITQNISKHTSPADWHFREAATFAYGSILDGPQPAAFADTVKQALGFLLQAMKDPHPSVKDTTAWTIGRIFEFLHAHDIEPAIITQETLPPIMAVLIESLKDQPHVVFRVCCAISHLAMGFQGTEGGTSPMSPFFKDTVAALLQTAQRHTNYEHSKVTISAFEAINDLVRAASRDTLDIVAQLIGVVLPELHKTFELPAGTAEAREKQAEVQGQLCGVLQVIVQKLSEEEGTKPAVMNCADQIMETLLRIFNNRSATVHEEAMLAVGSVSYALGKAFLKYLPTFVQYLKMGLTNYQEWQVCLSTVGVLGDICRNVEDGILPFCDEIMAILITNLGREDVHRTIKPQILAAFGDIALVVGDKYTKYLDAVLRVLKQAMQLSVMSAATADPDLQEYNNSLRSGIFDAYSGIIQGLGPHLCTQFLRGEVPVLIDFVSTLGVNIDPAEVDEEVMKSAINVLGDVASCIPDVGAALQASPRKEWMNVVAFSKESPNIQEECEWAIQQIEHVTRA